MCIEHYFYSIELIHIVSFHFHLIIFIVLYGIKTFKDFVWPVIMASKGYYRDVLSFSSPITPAMPLSNVDHNGDRNIDGEQTK